MGGELYTPSCVRCVHVIATTCLQPCLFAKQETAGHTLVCFRQDVVLINVGMLAVRTRMRERCGLYPNVPTAAAVSTFETMP